MRNVLSLDSQSENGNSSPKLAMTPKHTNVFNLASYFCSQAEIILCTVGAAWCQVGMANGSFPASRARTSVSRPTTRIPPKY